MTGWSPDLSWMPSHMPHQVTVTVTHRFKGADVTPTVEVTSCTKREITVKESGQFGIEQTGTVYSLPCAAFSNEHYPRAGDKLTDESTSRSWKVIHTQRTPAGVWWECFCVEEMAST